MDGDERKGGVGLGKVYGFLNLPFYLAAVLVFLAVFYRQETGAHWVMLSAFAGVLAVAYIPVGVILVFVLREGSRPLAFVVWVMGCGCLATLFVAHDKLLPYRGGW